MFYIEISEIQLLLNKLVFLSPHFPNGLISSRHIVQCTNLNCHVPPVLVHRPTAMIGVPADVSTDEANLIVRRLQLGAYYSLVNAFRASGYLTDKKLKILRELSLYFQLVGVG